ncbi:hypothetical protein QYE76_008205 [Lolium multiflorum]|uniref:TF-B3 domain-containing protein n=1 Tax=Lolium multiflorum TaxID=4521 RepID=A0AAD8QIK1_LOLMU|nr:hypothetical protein QYE76_008205 [Lolium multiflorum]
MTRRGPCSSSSSSSSRATRTASRGCRTPSPTTSPATPLLHLREDGCGCCRWIVDVIYDARGKMYLHIGWEKFARYHRLEAGFVLLFSYFGDRDMSVKVFDETRCRRNYHGDSAEEDDD